MSFDFKENLDKPEDKASVASLKRLPREAARRSLLLGEEEDGNPPDHVRMVKAYLPLGAVLAVLGGLVGLTCVVFQTPLYKTRVLLEVQPVSATVMSQGMDPFATVNNMDETNIETQISLFQSGPSVSRVRKQMQNIPSKQPRDTNQFFGRLRMLLRPKAAREAVSTPYALAVAADSFTARVINSTRLIEVSCESPQPSIASEFVNNVAQDFVNEAVRSRVESSEKTRDWLLSHIEDTKHNLEEADSKLRAFALKSGNVFVGNEATVDDVKLKQFQNDLAAAESDRLAKQARYESAAKENGESVSDVVQDPIAASIRTQLAELDRQRAVLLVTLTPSNPKVLSIDEQERERRGALKQAAANVIGRLKNEYDNAQRHEDLLIAAYSREGSQVNAQASKAEEYEALRREVDRLQKSYDSLLQEMNKTEVSQSAPVVPVRLVEPSAPPDVPYKPRPMSMLMLGVIGGLAATVGFAFIREKTDQRIHSPGSVQSLVRVPQLGVIPALDQVRIGASERRSPTVVVLPGAGSQGRLAPPSDKSGDSGAVARAAWRSENVESPLANSFRATLVSITRHLRMLGAGSKIILITSSIPGEGKTTVASNVGIALSEAGRSVVIIDADFRRPSLSKVFGVSNNRTLTKILWETQPIEEYRPEELATETGFGGLHIIPSAPSSSDPTQLIYSDRLPQLIERMRREYEFVILDAPPILFSADARVICQFVDGVVLVIRSGKSEREAIRAAVTCLQDDGVPVLGTVLTDWVPSGARSEYYYNYYATGKKTSRT